MDKRGERNDSPESQEGRQPYLVPVGKSHSDAPGCSMMTLRKWPHPPVPPSCCLPCLFRLQTLQGRGGANAARGQQAHNSRDGKWSSSLGPAQQHLRAQLHKGGRRHSGPKLLRALKMYYRPRAGKASCARSHAL